MHFHWWNDSGFLPFTSAVTIVPTPLCVCRYSDFKHSLEVGQGNPRCCADFKRLHLWVLWMAVIYFIFPSIWSSLLIWSCCQQIHCCSVQPGWLGAEHRVQPFWESSLLPQPCSSEECLSKETFCTQGAGRNLVLPDVVLPSRSLALGCCSCLWCLSPSPCMGCTCWCWVRAPFLPLLPVRDVFLIQRWKGKHEFGNNALEFANKFAMQTHCLREWGNV